MLFVTVCLCGQLFVDTWLGVWLNAAAEQVRHQPTSSKHVRLSFIYMIIRTTTLRSVSDRFLPVREN